MTADFVNKIVSGQLTGGVSGNRVDPSFDMTLGAAKIDGNQYTGPLIGGGASSAPGAATYTGKFFGPSAEETAGVIDYGGSDGTVRAGAFHVTKQ